MSTRSLWRPDVLGEGYEQCTYELGPDPDGEGDVGAVLVRRTPRGDETVRGAVLYVHGFSDYFFQTAMADFFAARDFAVYALDLRKCGRARRPGQTAHYASSLLQYDADLDAALAVIEREQPGLPVTLLAHSTSGLITREMRNPSPLSANALPGPSAMSSCSMRALTVAMAMSGGLSARARSLLVETADEPYSAVRPR